VQFNSMRFTREILIVIASSVARVSDRGARDFDVLRAAKP